MWVASNPVSRRSEWWGEVVPVHESGRDLGVALGDLHRGPEEAVIAGDVGDGMSTRVRPNDSVLGRGVGEGEHPIQAGLVGG